MDAATFGDWLAALLTLTCDEQPTLVAHSLPGNLVARFAARHRDALRRLVLVATPGLGRFGPPLGLLASAIRLNARPSQRNLERFSLWPYRDPQRTRTELGTWHDELDAYLLSRAAVGHVKRAMRELLRAARKPIPAAELHAITIPVALLWGSGDRMAPVSMAEVTSRDLGWPLRVIDEAGHLPHLEQPEAFAYALELTLDDA